MSAGHLHHRLFRCWPKCKLEEAEWLSQLVNLSYKLRRSIKNATYCPICHDVAEVV